MDRPAATGGGAEVDWDQIPLDKNAGESLGEFATRKAFAKAMVTPPAGARCASRWKAPPGVSGLSIETELRVRARNGNLVVEDVVIREANVGDAEIEACIVEELKGRQVAAPGTTPGAAYRIRWGVHGALR